MIKVFISGDYQQIHKGLKNILREDSEILIVGEVQNTEETIVKVQNTDCDIVLILLTSPEISSIKLITEIKKLKPEVQILILNLQNEDKFALKALNAGASGYLCKEEVVKNLLIAIRKIAVFGRYLSDATINKLAGEIMPTATVSQNRQLSAREMQTMNLLASGKKNKEIAEELGLGISTIHTYRTRIFEKLKIKNTDQLIQYALKKGLL